MGDEALIWVGRFDQFNRSGTYPMEVEIEPGLGRFFEGIIKWETLGNAATRMTAEYVDHFDDFLEIDRWREVPGWNSANPGLCFTFTETSFVRGDPNDVLLNTRYYACADEDLTIRGVNYRSDSDPEADGTFELVPAW